MFKKAYFVILPALITSGYLHASESSPRVLVAYYSMTGNTADVANAIHDAAGGDIYRIELVETYPTDKKELRAQLNSEIESNYLPTLRTPGPNIAEYDIVFLGSPVWAGHLSQPVKSFLNTYDLSGKTVIPFASHGGGGRGKLFQDVADLCVNCNVDTDGWSSWGGGRQGGIAKWVDKKLSKCCG